ncbi:MAG: hypothetical protein IPK17_00450 [Chloroflexi bacterium]|uniref:hypothetical protein n=1 Tax=Candidatus Flexifilum breve TaxID=3140694 RepID=UPI00313564BB|nr:hypothetical protein [Chloroflexota bacterium]
MARRMGVDPATEKPVRVRLSPTRRLAAGLFRSAAPPYEAMGVDFWWVDWQQGAKLQDSHA